MKPKLIFATSNEKKIIEVKAIIGEYYDVLSLKDIQFASEIPEPFDTIRENSIHKARYFYDMTKWPCIAEDSGLEVDFLEGKPSAFSARYAGEERDDVKNYEKVLTELSDSSQRNARFVSIITYKNEEVEKVFEGHMKGSIGYAPNGTNGFGYDPIFIPEGSSKSNAELTPDEKNSISHRRHALDLLTEYFTKLNAM
jgi:XTP/dITP diphosphohydrolase